MGLMDYLIGSNLWSFLIHSVCKYALFSWLIRICFSPKYSARHSCLNSTGRAEKRENERREWMSWEPRQLLYMHILDVLLFFLHLNQKSENIWYEAHCILYSTYLLHVSGPRPPGRKHQSCSRPACGPDQAQQDTNAGTTFPEPMRGHAPWTDRPVGRWGTMGREVWGGFAAERGSLQHACSNSSASKKLPGLKLLPAPPRENHSEKCQWWKKDSWEMRQSE